MPERKMGVVVEEERSDVVVVDEEQDVRFLLREPLSTGWYASKDGRPDWIVLLLPVQRKPDRR